MGENVFVARGTALGPWKKSTSFTSKFYGPSTVLSVKHPYYAFVLPSGRRTRRGIHARRLARIYDRSAHFICSSTARI